MATKTKQWSTGTGSATIQYGGQGDGEIIITSDANSLYEARSMQIAIETTDGSGIQKTITINQAAKQRIDLSAAVVTASNQTYSGSAKTPTPTVTLNGTTIPSTGYDVAYSNNTNAGTANITITGKGDYTGTAYGTFTINKATPSYTAPAARTNLTYSGGNQYLTTTGYTNDGTIKYSLDGVNWYTTRRQGSTAGTYTSYWKIEGDSNHTDISSTSISTTIAKASRTLSFVDTYMVLNTSSTGTKTATPSAGNGDGDTTYSIANTTYATINSSTGAVTAKTSDGSVTVTATIAEGTNYLSATATYTLYVFATTHNYSYNGSYRSVTLPPGIYQFQVWGAQGGGTTADSAHGIATTNGGKGGYSVGQLTISQAIGVRVYVGGQGSASAGGYNGGGSTTGSSSKNANNENGVSKMAGGGGASDIRLSDGSLYSRMIVAGGGSGGGAAYKEVTTEVTDWRAYDSYSLQRASDGTSLFIRPITYTDKKGKTLRFSNISFSTSGYDSSIVTRITVVYRNSANEWVTSKNVSLNEAFYVGNYSNIDHLDIYVYLNTTVAEGTTANLYCQEQYIHTEKNTDSAAMSGFIGGGELSAGYDIYHRATQTAAGRNGSFGQGANQTATTYRYCSGAGGGGWYGGGGGRYSDDSLEMVNYSGGGSGFVNTAASAGNRPSGYTGLELDNGTTYQGNISFPAPGGGNETGHSGDGYIRITRIS